MKTQPEYNACRRELEEIRQDRVRQHALIARPVIENLKQAGYPVESLDELRTSGAPYKSAIPILLRWLPSISDERVKESVVRTLSVPWAKPAAAMPLIAEFLAAPESAEGLKWAIGNALEVVGDDSVFDRLAELAANSRHGRARQMIVLSLGKMKDPRAFDILVDLLADDEVSGHALMALVKLDAQRARPHIERFANDPRAWVRKRCIQALSKLR